MAILDILARIRPLEESVDGPPGLGALGKSVDGPPGIGLLEASDLSCHQARLWNRKEAYKSQNV